MGIEADRGLVHDDDSRFCQDRFRNADALFVAFG